MTQKYNLENFTDTLTVSHIDIDNDGDLDIITTSLFWEILVFKNKLPEQAASIKITLKDYMTKNTQWIGGKIIIHHSDWSQQMRNIYIWWHFLSLQNPTQVFWLGTKKIQYIDIVWPDWSKSKIDQSFAPNRHYSITRSNEK